MGNLTSIILFGSVGLLVLLGATWAILHFSWKGKGEKQVIEIEKPKPAMHPKSTKCINALGMMVRMCNSVADDDIT